MAKLALAALLALALPTAARGGEIVITVTGIVNSISPAVPSGPFTGAAAQDPVTLRITVNLPGLLFLPNEYVMHSIDPARSTLTIGAVTAPLGPALFHVRNDTPIVDSLALDPAPIVGGGTLEFWLRQDTGTWFNSPYLAQNLGTWPVSFFGADAFNYSMLGGFIDFNPLDVTIARPTIGTNYCAPIVPNSTGATGVISAFGSTSVAANDLTLRASSLPSNAFGYFLVSRTPATIPSPTAPFGVVCLTGAIGRFAQQAQNSGSAGEFSIAVDLGALPQPSGPVAVLAGETWHFQAWHRDSLGGGATSNLTNGVAVTFQ